MKRGDLHGFLEALEVIEDYRGVKVRASCNKCGREIWISKTKFNEQTMCYECRCEKYGGEKAYEEKMQNQRESKHLCWTCIHATNKYKACDWSAWGIARTDWKTSLKSGGKFNIVACGGYINDKYKEQYEKERTK